MLYKYDKNSLQFKNVTKHIVIGMLVVMLMTTIVIGSIAISKANDIEYISQETKLIIIKQAQADTFSIKNLKEYILELNLKFPDIVFAQAQLETGHFKSPIFKENNNLFGMKVATIRPTTSKGVESGHAVFDTWQESVIDYAFYQAKYLSKLNRDEYFNALGVSYAEDPNYVEKVKKNIESGLAMSK